MGQTSGARSGNLTPAGRRQRLVLGVVAGVAAVAGLVWIASAAPPWPARLAVGAAFLVAGLGLFQAGAGT